MNKESFTKLNKTLYFYSKACYNIIINYGEVKWHTQKHLWRP